MHSLVLNDVHKRKNSRILLNFSLRAGALYQVITLSLGFIVIVWHEFLNV